MIKNLLIAFEKWLETTPIDRVTIKLFAIGVVVWAMWCAFSYAWQYLTPHAPIKPRHHGDDDNFTDDAAQLGI